MGDVSMDGHKGGEPFLGRTALPEIEVPRLGVGRRRRPVRLHRLPASPASFLKVSHNQYFSTAKRGAHPGFPRNFDCGLLGRFV